MRITMVKKRLANGEPCEKCAQTEEMLKRRGLWERIDEVVWAVEGEPDSPGARLGRRVGVELAPFFVVEREGAREVVFTSPLRMIRELFPHPPSARPGPRRDVASAELATLADRLASAPPEEILRWALERYGERCAISFGGGEEVVLIDMATQLGLPFSVVTLDTGRLHAETHEFLDEIRRRYGVAARTILPDAEELSAFVERKGLYSFRRDGHLECCTLRKLRPLRRALADVDAWVTGRRRDRGGASAGLAVLHEDRELGPATGGLVRVNPLAGWTHDRVWQYIRAHGVPSNPLHDRGFTTLACEPCTRAPRPGEADGRWWWERKGGGDPGSARPDMTGAGI